MTGKRRSVKCLVETRSMLAAPDERIRLDARRHEIVLARPLGRALALAVVGLGFVLAGFPYSPVGAILLAVAAAVALRAVWGWERTRIVVTSEKLFVVYGTLRRRAAAVRLSRVSTVEVEESPLGRLLGYGTIVAGELEIQYVARPRDVCRLLR
jgi:membrane protein YdbS with pleckstrin-like domain